MNTSSSSTSTSTSTSSSFFGSSSASRESSPERSVSVEVRQPFDENSFLEETQGLRVECILDYAQANGWEAEFKELFTREVGTIGNAIDYVRERFKEGDFFVSKDALDIVFLRFTKKNDLILLKPLKKFFTKELEKAIRRAFDIEKHELAELNWIDDCLDDLVEPASTKKFELVLAWLEIGFESGCHVWRYNVAKRALRILLRLDPQCPYYDRLHVNFGRYLDTEDALNVKALNEELQEEARKLELQDIPNAIEFTTAVSQDSDLFAFNFNSFIHFLSSFNSTPVNSTDRKRFECALIPFLKRLEDEQLNKYFLQFPFQILFKYDWTDRNLADAACSLFRSGVPFMTKEQSGAFIKMSIDFIKSKMRESRYRNFDYMCDFLLEFNQIILKKFEYSPQLLKHLLKLLLERITNRQNLLNERIEDLEALNPSDVYKEQRSVDILRKIEDNEKALVAIEHLTHERKATLSAQTKTYISDLEKKTKSLRAQLVQMLPNRIKDIKESKQSASELVNQSIESLEGRYHSLVDAYTDDYKRLHDLFIIEYALLDGINISYTKEKFRAVLERKFNQIDDLDAKALSLLLEYAHYLEHIPVEKIKEITQRLTEERKSAKLLFAGIDEGDFNTEIEKICLSYLRDLYHRGEQLDHPVGLYLYCILEDSDAKELRQLVLESYLNDEKLKDYLEWSNDYLSGHESFRDRHLYFIKNLANHPDISVSQIGLIFADPSVKKDEELYHKLSNLYAYKDVNLFLEYALEQRKPAILLICLILCLALFFADISSDKKA